MQTAFFERNKPLKTVVATQVLKIVPAEMVSAYVPDQTGLKLSDAVEIARRMDEEEAANFILSMEG